MPLLRMLPLIFLGFDAACAPNPKPRPLTAEELQQGPLAFVQDGRSTREDIILKLGTPAAEFERARILTYRIAQTPGGGINVVARDSIPASVPQPPTDYSLVLVFDANGVLTRHSLVRIR